jgi:hypothetical protein
MRGTAIFWATLIPILFIGTILYVIYKIRRVSQERRQRSDERAAAVLAKLQTHAPEHTAAPETTIVAAAAPQNASSTQQQLSSAFTRRARILTDAQRLLFLVLRAAMPEHFIMAHVRIVDLLDLSPAPDTDDARLRALARERLDFVVCDADLVPVAAIVLYDSGLKQVPDESTKVEALRAIGIRFLRFRVDSLPRPAEVRNLVLA